jgi:hypothetical protein
MMFLGFQNSKKIPRCFNAEYRLNQEQTQKMKAATRGASLCPHSSFLVPHSSFLIPRSSFLVPHSSFLIPRSSFLVPHSSFLIPRSSFPKHRKLGD